MKRVIKFIPKLSFRYFLLFFAVFNVIFCSVIFYTYFPTWKRWYIQRSYSQLVANTELSKPGLAVRLEEKSITEIQLISSIMQQTPDREANQERLSQQTREIARTVGADFGEEKEQEIFTLLAEYNTALIDYCNGSKEKNTELQTKSLVKLTAFPKKYARFFAGLSKNVGYEVIQFAMTEYQATLKTTIDSQAAGDYKAAFTHSDAAKLQAKQLALVLEKSLTTTSAEK